MPDTSAAKPTLTIAILRRHCLVWLGLQNILESSATLPMVVHPHQGWITNRIPTEIRADVFIIDLETTREAIGTIKQIRANRSRVLFGQ